MRVEKHKQVDPYRDTVEDVVQLNRRQVLALTGLGAAAAGIGASIVGVSWWNRTPGAEYIHIDQDEATFLRAFAGAAWPSTDSIPHGGSELNLDHFFDETLGHLGEEPRNQIRLLLHAIESATLTTHLNFFSALPQQERQILVQDWLDHLIPEVRHATQALCILTGSGYSTHPDVAPFFEAMHGCGYGRTR